ncbi:hypothetical protein E2C01_003288 [Portunus trituberculatus]|uniref:Uncharacterized protein n=1 Tax=Portunus trituberculatus TaxID=210409 RepID=A0A5B7CM70_PORTR|nr:hypothetical protein [Portunus trituberculatus]
MKPNPSRALGRHGLGRLCTLAVLSLTFRCIVFNTRLNKSKAWVHALVGPVTFYAERRLCASQEDESGTARRSYCKRCEDFGASNLMTLDSGTPPSRRMAANP